MKKLIISLILILFLTSCSNKIEKGKLNASVSFYPLSYFTKEIGQDKVNVINILDKGSDAHTFEPSIQDRINIEKSDIFIYNGLDLEHWVEKTIDSMQIPSLKILDSSEGINTIMHDDHPDPHIWLDPYTANIQAKNIYKSLIELDQDNEAYYTSNYAILENKFIELQTVYDEAFARYEGKSIVLEHEIFSYLAHRYNFNQVSVSGLIPESEPSFQELSHVIDYLLENDIKYVLLSKYDSNKVIETIKKETNVEILIIDSMEIGTEDFDYFAIMKENLKSLIGALNYE